MTTPAASPPRIVTQRLLLDAHTIDDFEHLAAMWADPEVTRHISGMPSSREKSWFRLLRYAGLWPLLGYGYWAVREQQTGRFIGEIGFADFLRNASPPISGKPEMGWILATSAHGKGYASEAVSAALSWLDRNSLFDEAICLIGAENTASLRIAAKNGFLPANEIALNGENIPLFSRHRKHAA